MQRYRRLSKAYDPKSHAIPSMSCASNQDLLATLGFSMFDGEAKETVLSEAFDRTARPFCRFRLV